MEFFLNKAKDQVMKTKEKLCQKRLFQNLLVPGTPSSTPVSSILQILQYDIYVLYGTVAQYIHSMAILAVLGVYWQYLYCSKIAILYWNMLHPTEPTAFPVWLTPVRAFTPVSTFLGASETKQP